MSTSSNRLQNSSLPQAVSPDDLKLTLQDANVSADKSPTTAAEDEELRAEKLAAIRKAIDDGAYDSEEVLEKALSRMLQSFKTKEK